METINFKKLKYHLVTSDGRLLGKFYTLENLEKFAGFLNPLDLEAYYVRGKTREVLKISQYTTQA